MRPKAKLSPFPNMFRASTGSLRVLSARTQATGLHAFPSAPTTQRALVALILALPLQVPSTWAATDLVVVVNPASGVERMNREEVTALFMGRTKKLPSGIMALPIDQTASGDRPRFYRELVNKEPAEINAYWARLIFSGQGSPPRQADNAAEVIEIVSGNKGAIGYLPRGVADRRVRVVLDLAAQ